jgi:hypothetical protein
MWKNMATTVTSKKPPQENNHPKGENLPNLVTLLTAETSLRALNSKWR